MSRNESTKSDRLNVRISGEERRRLERVAAARGLSLSQLVLELVRREDVALTRGNAPRVRM